MSDIVIQLQQSESLSVIARAELIAQAIQQIPKKELSVLLNKSPSYISNHLRLTRLPEIIKEGLISSVISEGHARAISFLEAEADMTRVYEGILRRRLSVRDTELEVRRMRQNVREYGKVAPELSELTNRLAVRWGIVASLKRKNRSLVLTLSFPLGIVYLRKLQAVFKRLLAD